MRLTRWERKWFAAVVESFAPAREEGRSGEGLAPKPGEVDYASDFERLNRHATVLAQVGLRFGIALVGLSPAWTGKGLRGLDALGPEQRAELVDSLTRHPNALVREMTWLMKVQASMSLFGEKSIRARSRYDEGRDEGMPVRIKVLRQGKLVEVA
ncbi:MAG: hypothetical protein AAGE52_20965 [Myxococcota bacterium]